jgi:hypothetical protein
MDLIRQHKCALIEQSLAQAVEDSQRDGDITHLWTAAAAAVTALTRIVAEISTAPKE